ncbi:MAG TPA: hypothetical protein VNJ51_00590 [Candidatus Dormibacteraeota bacterium]|nr:hypothetical protein [Candidatus Dormibacteraeota bacterium]
MNDKRLKRLAQGAGIGAGALALLYALALRPWQQRWGATEEELLGVLPGDDQVRDPVVETTRAVTIDAPPRAVWPWIVQIGTGRAGWYSYDWVESLMGLRVRSAERIMPELQALNVGDVIPVRADGGGAPVVAVEPNGHLVVAAHDDVVGDFSWSFVLRAAGTERQTRLIVRMRGRPKVTAASLPWLVAVDPGEFLMTRKMLLGIKARAERPPAAA